MHVIIWEFHVSEVHQSAFETAYGPAGDWAVLFQRHPGYRGTELLRDEKRQGRYVTIDRWETRSAFDAMRATDAEAYATLDRRFDELTDRETLIGDFKAC